MARKKTGRKSSGGRGSAEAIEKRRTARQLNALLTGGTRSSARLDGRTEKRRKRLIKELKEGRSDRALKPIDFVSHVNELYDLGETSASLRKQGVRPRRADQSDEIVEIARRTQEAYGFRPEAWKMLGILLDESDKAAAPRKRASKATKRRPKKR
jgi:hypothetical protein